ncbi:radical SAM/SPASM domain-containing protein [Psychromonas ossibalaenae]|uniref:radical SAM/SPASM domain-containing protein n=1 Tax=Psychromonas ossibalaenae TaxID=444922 RepID=UPI00037D2D81|nr:SPASM domain-containing protein [Psychromonas ossibalaenae]
MPSKKFIHLLYAPTNFCNMGCKYCYLGTGTDQKNKASQTVSTLEHAVQQFLNEDIIPFNLSFHGGEPTSIPPQQLAELFEFSKNYYAEFGAQIKQAGYPLNPIHIKTNLFNFDRIYALCDDYQVSISGSVDLPLFLHEKYRTDKRGRSTLAQIRKNLKLLADYPHHKKISCVVTQEHLNHLDEFIADIKHIHYDIGLDMSKFNIMFSFDSDKNSEKFAQENEQSSMLTQEQQLYFYQRLSSEFTGTELEQGLKEHWFKEFTPEFCCSAVNCGDKFFLLQSNGDVYSCPRGQSSRQFFYGNLYKQPITDIIANGWQVIESIENRLQADQECFSCSYLPYCNQGCVFVRQQTGLTKSYTCLLQKALYKDNPERYPAYDETYIKQYAANYKYKNSIQSFKENQIETVKPRYITPELYADSNALTSLIAADEVLQTIYSDTLFSLQVDGVDYALTSPVLHNSNDLALLNKHASVILKVREDIFNLHSKDPVNNCIHLMLLRNTMVTYGDEGREKQEHIVDYSLYKNSFELLSENKDGWYLFDLRPFLQQHQALFLPDVRNNLYFTTKTLREYHYSKQKKNAFYHIQAINLPFPYLEFYWAE